MTILFGPDYRRVNSYQGHLEEALGERGTVVRYIAHRGRFFPLWRDTRGVDGALIHLHWPEGYWVGLEQRIRTRVRRFSGGPLLYMLDLRMALWRRKTRLVVTAHNIRPHTNGDGYWVRRAIELTARKAEVIIAHSEAAAEAVAAEWRVPRGKIAVIAHGDLSAVYGQLEKRREARARLPIAGDGPVFLIFGIIKAYKGVEEVMAYWKRERPGARLAVVGECLEPELGGRLRALAAGCPEIYLSLDRWLPETELAPWLAAASGVIFNYRRTLTSGAASLARSLGVPILIHRRAHTVDLGEPHASVFRYDALEGEEFRKGLAGAAALADATERAEGDPAWAASIGWGAIAERTLAVYRRAGAYPPGHDGGTGGR